MYKNTEIQQKDSVATGAVAGAMAPFTGQIRTSQEREKRNPCPKQTAPTDGREDVEYSRSLPEVSAESLD